MKNNIKFISSLIILIFFLGCESTELDLQTDPNNPGPESLDPDTNLNFVLFSLSEFFEQATEAGGEAVRLEYMLDTYEINFQNDDTNLANMWSVAYADILSEIQTIEPILEETERYAHLGILKTVRAYTLMTLVDFFGDVPFSELGETFPSLDNAQDVYNQALADLNDVEFQFSREQSDGTSAELGTLANDNFYNGDLTKWLTLANTLKLKYYLNLRLTDETTAQSEIANLLNGGNIITTSDNDFTWKASVSESPQSKHQYYIDEYEAGSLGEYIPNYLAWALTEEKGIDDPRLRFYIYRQRSDFPTDPATLNNVIDCWNDPRPSTYAPIDNISSTPLPFCALFDRGDGYWGRDHANAQGIPPDTGDRMTFGVYPIGGRFDNNDAQSIRAAQGEGIDGAGIWPIMMNSFVYFMRAEAALYLSTGEDARSLLETGVRESINTVINFGGSYTSDILNTVIVPDDPDTTDEDETVLRRDILGIANTDIENYVNTVLGLYDAASSDDQRMGVVGKEYWLAMFCNGIEGYNLYRRTGTPFNLQPTLLGTGNFPRTFLYPNVTVDRNPNIDQKLDGTRVKTFWDNNPDNFIQ